MPAACGARGRRRRAGGLRRYLQHHCWGTPPAPWARARVLWKLGGSLFSGYLFGTRRSLSSAVAAVAQWCDGSLRPLLTVGRTRCPSSSPAHWPGSWLVVVLLPVSLSVPFFRLPPVLLFLRRRLMFRPFPRRCPTCSDCFALCDWVLDGLLRLPLLCACPIRWSIRARRLSCCEQTVAFPHSPTVTC